MNVPHIRLARVPFLAAIAALSSWLVLTSSLANLAPTPPPLLWILAGTTIALLPALISRGTPLPATIPVLLSSILVSTYAQSHLDWLRLLKDFNVTDPGAPDPLRLGLAFGALALTWMLHVHDHALRLRARARERGMDAREARAAYRIALRVGSRRGAFALGGALVVAAVGTAGGALGLDKLLLGRSALLAPLLAAALVIIAAVVLARSRSAA